MSLSSVLSQNITLLSFNLQAELLKNPKTKLKQSNNKKMHLQTQSLSFHLPLSPTLLPKPKSKPQFSLQRQNPYPQFSLKCSLSTAPELTRLASSNNKPFPAEVSRTIMELSSVATLSTLTPEAWPLGVGVRFAVDEDGAPILCLVDSQRTISLNKRSSLHVQLVQSGMRTPQCTVQGLIGKPEDKKKLKWLQSVWKKKFEEEIDEEFIHVVAVDRVLQMEDFMEDGVWVSSLDYKNASPDPLRDFAEEIINEINTKNVEDIYRFCNIYADLNFLVSEVKMIWIDKLGFDLRLSSPQNGVFDIRIPFPREVTDLKTAKSSFNGMAQLAWEVEKHYSVPNWEKVKQLKQIR